MNDHIIDLIVRLRDRAENDKSKPEEWAFGQKPNYLKYAADVKNQFGITEQMISDFTRVLDQVFEDKGNAGEHLEELARMVGADGPEPDAGPFPPGLIDKLRKE